MGSIYDILKHYFGYDQFRSNQVEIIESVLSGIDTLALLPTGGGKSICYQVPGLINGGTTLVISPLIALMQDQVKALKCKNIKAEAVFSGLNYRELDILLDNSVHGPNNFLYVSPERLKTRLFIERFKRMKIGLIVVDEAHCISEWGHDFRPSYLEIHQLRQWHPKVPIIAVTATATTKVQEDIIKHLQLKKPNVFSSSFERSNLKYQIVKTENKIARISEFILNQKDKSGIVYCQTRKSVKEVARILIAQNIKVGIYHGGMSAGDREWMLKDWMNNERRVIIATNAFGMGIDKPDVRYVMHYEVPNNLEAYYQEAGRGGRDGAFSLALGFVSSADIEKMKTQWELNFPTREDLILVFRALSNHLKIAIGSGKDETYELNIQKLCSQFNLSLPKTFAALKALQLNGNLEFNESFFSPTKLKFAIGNTELYSFQVRNERVSPLISMLTRSYPGIFQLFFEINEKEFTKRLNITSIELENQLKYLEQMGIIDIQWQTDLPTVTFIRERPANDNLFWQDDQYFRLKEKAKERLEKMIDFLNSKECRNQVILDYFNQPNTACGICDNCQDTNDKRSQFELNSRIESILDIPHSTSEIEKKINLSSERLNEILKALLLENRIQLKNGLYQKA